GGKPQTSGSRRLGILAHNRGGVTRKRGSVVHASVLLRTFRRAVSIATNFPPRVPRADRPTPMEKRSKDCDWDLPGGLKRYRLMIKASSLRESANEVLAELSFTLMLKLTVIVARVSTACPF